VASRGRRVFCNPGTRFGEGWRVRGTTFPKLHIISPGIVILLTAAERWVLSSVDYLSVRVGVFFAKTMTSLLIIPTVLALAVLLNVF